MEDNKTIDTGSIIAATVTILVIVAIGFGIKNTIDRSDRYIRNQNQIIAENPGCIFIEKSNLADQYYMVCEGQLVARGLKPVFLPVPSPSPTQAEASTNTTSEVK